MTGPPRPYLPYAELSTEKLVAKAQTGNDYFAGHQLLWEVWGCLQHERPVQGRLAEYLKTCISRTLLGERADRAFNMIKPPHRPPDPDRPAREMLLATFIGTRLLKGKTVQEAFADAKEHYRVHGSGDTILVDRVSESTAARAWARYGDHVRKWLLSERD